jgi:TonB-dependent receptor
MTHESRRGRMADVWMAGLACLAIAMPGLMPAPAFAQVPPQPRAATARQATVAPIDAADRTSPAPPPGTSIVIDRAWSAARERDATNIVSIIAGAQISATPTSNVPENLAALPSVAIERVLGEGRTVRIRGLDPRWSSVQLDGDRLPSVDGQTRATPLNILPGEFFEAIQISRTITANMDGDAIDGAINLVPRRPTEQPRGSFALSGGYHGLRGDGDDVGVNGVFGRRFANGRVGVTAGGSGLHETLSGNGFDASYNDALALTTFFVRSAVTDRSRAGGLGTVDVKMSDRASVVFSGIAGQLRDQSYERMTLYLPATTGGSISRALGDDPVRETLWSGSARGQYLLRNNGTLDARVAVGQGRQRVADGRDSFFYEPNVPFAPGFGNVPNDPENIQIQPLRDDLTAYGNGSQDLSEALATETAVTAAANMTMPIAAAGPGPRVIKFGAKLHHLDKQQDRHSTSVYGLPALSGVADLGFDSGPILDGRYTLGPTIDPALARQLGTTPAPVPAAVLRLNQYDGRESTLSAYVMTDLAIGSRVTLEPGVRYEWDQRRYHAWSVVTDFDSPYLATPQDASTTRGEWLPIISARIAASPHTTIRAAITRSIARPDFSDLAPFMIGLSSLVFNAGSPDLRDTSSWNADLMLDQELTRGSGRVFAALFHKRISDPVYLARLDPDAAPRASNPVQPRNGDRASLTGVEIVTSHVPCTTRRTAAGRRSACA